MWNLKSFVRIAIITLEWMIVWGLVAAAVAAVVTVIQPDTGHIPGEKVPLMMGVPSAVFGGMVGLIFACMLEASRVRNFLGSRSRIVLGGLVGAAGGIVLMNLWVHSIFTILLSAFLGAVLACNLVRYAFVHDKDR